MTVRSTTKRSFPHGLRGPSSSKTHTHTHTHAHHDGLSQKTSFHRHSPHPFHLNIHVQIQEWLIIILSRPPTPFKHTSMVYHHSFKTTNTIQTHKQTNIHKYGLSSFFQDHQHHSNTRVWFIILFHHHSYSNT